MSTPMMCIDTKRPTIASSRTWTRRTITRGCWPVSALRARARPEPSLHTSVRGRELGGLIHLVERIGYIHPQTGRMELNHAVDRSIHYAWNGWQRRKFGRAGPIHV